MGKREREIWITIKIKSGVIFSPAFWFVLTDGEMEIIFFRSSLFFLHWVRLMYKNAT